MLIALLSISQLRNNIQFIGLSTVPRVKEENL
jgi:hypothetical protein